MKINFFGNLLEINIKTKDNKGESFMRYLFKDRYFSHIIMYVLIVGFFFVLISLKNNTETYVLGSIAKNDVIAYKDLTYTKNILDDDLKQKIEKNTTPEYDRLEDVSKVELDKLEQFFQNLNSLDLNNKEEVSDFIKLYSLKLSVKDVLSLGINKSVKYYLYLYNILDEVYQVGIYRESDFNRILADKEIILTEQENKLLKNFIEPNLQINRAKTLQKIEKNMEMMRNSVVKIHKGDLILKEGSVITDSIYNDLAHLGYVNAKDSIIRILGGFLTFVIASFIFISLSIYKFKENFDSKEFYPIFITTIIINLGYYLFMDKLDVNYLAPLLLLPIVSSILYKEYIFVFSLVAYNYFFIIEDLKWMSVILLLSILAIYINSKVTSRNEIVRNSIYLGLIQSIFTFAVGVSLNYELLQIIPNVIYSILSGVLTGVFSLGLLPYFENSFNILTNIKLLELSNFSNKLLKELLLIAPGTFHHSIMVGALSEAGAEAIGANSILCRVASYYHDIGKMKRPKYFVENQQGIINPHNNLKPQISALIITSHRKDGYILGKQYGLPKEILDIILEHHGTTLVQYFYYKALESGEDILEKDFRYGGPRPSSKESGVIMLADTIEAAVRATSDKRMESIEKLVRYLIKSKVEDGQLNDCGMTFEEVEKVTQSFLNILKGIYHERIKYNNGIS